MARSTSLIVTVALMLLLTITGCGGGTVAAPSAVQTAPFVLPGSVRTVTSTPDATFVFTVDTAVAPADEAAIRAGLELGQEFLKQVFGRNVNGTLNVAITAQVGDVPANSAMTFNTHHPVWAATSEINKKKIAIHELFHDFQGRYNVTGPKWFVEGGAEYAGYQGVAYGGLLPFETARRCQIFSMAHGVDPALTLQDGGIPPSGGYWLGFLGVDFMSGSSAEKFAAIINNGASAWEAKMPAVTGLSVEEFYRTFEEARRRYDVPRTYDCPS